MQKLLNPFCLEEVVASSADTLLLYVTILVCYFLTSLINIATRTLLIAMTKEKVCTITKSNI